jgi:hypothetical protein
VVPPDYLEAWEEGSGTDDRAIQVSSMMRAHGIEPIDEHTILFISGDRN